MRNAKQYGKIKVINFISKKDYKTYKIPYWYKRRDTYEYLQSGKYFKNCEVEYDIAKNYLRLDSELNDNLKLKITRDYYKSVLYEEDQDNDRIILKENNQNNTGVFWLNAGNNIRMHASYLFEFDKFLPKPFKSAKSVEDNFGVENPGSKQIVNNFYLHTQMAPFNPVTSTTFVQEYNYFNILDYPGYNGERDLNYSEIDYFTEVIEEQMLSFINNKKIDNLIVGGFSQAACMALHASLKLKNPILVEKIKGVIAFNGFLFKHTPIDYERFRSLNFLIINGVQDDVVLLREAENSFTRLNEKHKMYIESCKSFYDGNKNSKDSDGDNFTKEKDKQMLCGSIDYYKENGLHHSFSRFGLEKAHDFILKISQTGNR